MKQSYTIQNSSKIIRDKNTFLSPKLLKLRYLLQNSKINTITNSDDSETLRLYPMQSEKKSIGFDMSKDFSFYFTILSHLHYDIFLSNSIYFVNLYN